MNDTSSNGNSGNQGSDSGHTAAERDASAASKQGQSATARTEEASSTGGRHEELAALRAEHEAALDRALRAQAELENFRRRTRRDMEEERKYSQLPFLAELLPVLDNVGRAIQAAEKTKDAASLLEGFKMVAQQLEGTLTRFQCTRIEAQGQAFDPHLHSAILQQPSAEHPPGTVVHVVQDGYQLHDRVVRPAQVIVAAPNTPAPADPTTEAATS